MIFDDSTGILIQAIHFSASKHRDQRRKDVPHSPYINHPLDVAKILWEAGDVRDSITLVAAVLHDTIEDTNTTPAELEALFGDEVLQVVLEVTDDKSLAKAERKRLQILHAPLISHRAKIIKLADITCNLFDLIYSPPRIWSIQRKKNYLYWTENVVAGLRGTNAAMESRFDQYMLVGRNVLEKQ
jgi:guanosine-3',5'-bis(diphosphate) 3'-pyrophosphohydrolase